jgi:glycosyltransferase involved in cell wall biosynthesis
MKIAIVGPGLLQIPPRGWGATETIIHETQAGLEARGHHVLVVNTRDKKELISQTNSFEPDFVYCQYDERIDVMHEIACRNKAITSHFGYLDQVWRFPKYKKKIHDRILANKDVHVFALSPSIARIYLSGGVPAGRVHVLPNGVHVSKFRVADSPAHPKRSICLGRIDVRKRQGLLQSICPDVDFAGNICGKTGAASGFNARLDTYLGEWDREKVYDSLTDYANLVLLSDGEAHPLVCIEGLAAGLGLVVSEWAAANLDTSLPFITVIPERKMTDTGFIRDSISNNRAIALKSRHEIVEYAKQFDYSRAIDNLEELVIKIAGNGELVLDAPRKKTIGIVITLIGLYFDVYFEKLAHSLKSIFSSQCDVRIFCFTDKQPQELSQQDAVDFVHVHDNGWPFNSLLRFHMIMSIADRLRTCDNIFAIDGDMVCENEIDHSILEEDLFAVAHPAFEFRMHSAPFEADAKSSSFVKKDLQGHYVQGCFFGGKTEPFLYLCGFIRDAVHKDLISGEIPVWHDESYLNWFFAYHAFRLVPTLYAHPEGKPAVEKPCLVHLKKKNDVIRKMPPRGGDAEELLHSPTSVDRLEMYRTLYLKTHEKTQRLEFKLLELAGSRSPVLRAWDHSRRLRKKVSAALRQRLRRA